MLSRKSSTLHANQPVRRRRATRAGERYDKPRKKSIKTAGSDARQHYRGCDSMRRSVEHSPSARKKNDKKTFPCLAPYCWFPASPRTQNNYTHNSCPNPSRAADDGGLQKAVHIRHRLVRVEPAVQRLPACKVDLKTRRVLEHKSELLRRRSLKHRRRCGEGASHF